jgi:Xaa-Pro aminopeptidase
MIVVKGIFSRDELHKRIDTLQTSVQKAGLDGALIVQRADMVYYTGSAYQGVLSVPANGNPRLFVWRGIGLVGDTCPIEPETVKGFGKLTNTLNEAGLNGWKRVGIEEDVLPLSWYRRFKKAIWPDSELVDISTAIRVQRSIKSEEELVQVRESGRILAAGFEELRIILNNVEFEYEAQAMMDIKMRREGDQAYGRTRAFNAEARGVVACGRSASVDTAFDGPIGQPGRTPLAPFGAGGNRIETCMPIISDHTAGYNGYMTDMTRSYYLGNIDQRFIDAHNFCVEIHLETLKRMVPGAIPSEIYLWSVAEAEKAGYGEVFMNSGNNRVRFLAHGVGLELDEWPVLAKPFRDPLVENMVIAVEPKIIFEDGAVGVEDTVIVKREGTEVVTPMEHGLIKVD